MNSKKYLLGLDLGTNSVGWCLTDQNYDVVKIKGKSLHGIRRFEEAQSKGDKRSYRTARRRMQRRRERIELLQQLFAEEIGKVDQNFYNKLDQSFLQPEDRIIQDTIFLPENQNNERFKTIYHLRKYLLETDEKADIRTIYLAFHHMLKYRGHFLLENFDTTNKGSIIDTFSNLNENIEQIGLEENFKFIVKDDFKVLILKNKGVNDTKLMYKNYFNSGKNKLINSYIELMAGGTLAVKKLFNFDIDEENELEDEILNLKVTFKEESFELTLLKIESYFSQRPELKVIINLKEIYDAVNLYKVLGESTTISSAMVNAYNLHHEQLKELKFMIRKYFDKKTYNEMFREYSEIENYSKYIGSVQTKTKKIQGAHEEEKGAFYKYVKKVLEPLKNIDEEAKTFYEKVEKEMSNETYLPRMNSTVYSNLPFQLNKVELERIIEKQSKFYSFLNDSDNYGTVGEKIVSIIEYRIPYFVGPLLAKKENDERGKYSWIVRKEDKITPWNFKDVVDEEQTQIQFIDRMLNTCTYLKDQKCLPKDSIILQYLNVLNEINKIFINGVAISSSIKEDLIKNLYLEKKVTQKTLLNYFKSISGEDVKLTSSNEKEVDFVNSSLSTYIDFKNIFGAEFVDKNIFLIEDIIRDIAIFSDEKTLQKRLKSKYNLTDEKQIKKVAKLKYSGFGRLSKKLLCDIKVFVNDTISVSENGEILPTSIIESMRQTNSNFMELVATNNSPFKVEIDKYNKELNLEYSNYNDFIADQYVSPGMKKPLLQSMKIIEELERIIQAPIDEFYIETVRSNKADKKRTLSRKQRLQTIYEEAIKLSKDVELVAMKKTLDEQIDSRLNSEKIYLYFMQFGKDMYSLEKIDFNDLFSDKYDVDHIIPQSLLKDDSFENKVLTSRVLNSKKSDTFPLSEGFLHKDAKKFYEFLEKNKLMGSKKFHNLTRCSELTPDEIKSFVNRQLVYTSQATKGLKEVIEKFKNTDKHKVKIVFSKAENISDFRKKFDLLKSRTANNFHHAHDAYLNIVVGRTIDTYYFNGEIKKIREFYNAKKLTMNPMNIFSKEDRIVKNIANEHVWDYSLHAKIRNYITKRFDFLTSWQETISNKIIEKVSLQNKETSIPVKTINTPETFKEVALSKLSNTVKYGGFTSLSYSHYTLVEHMAKDKKVVTLCKIPKFYVSNTMNSNLLINYIENEFGYKHVKILVPIVKTKTTLRNGESEVIIRSLSEAINVRNSKELIYNYEQLTLIKLIEKILTKLIDLKLTTTTIFDNKNIDKRNNFIFTENEVALYASKDKTVKNSIKNEELTSLFSYIVDALVNKKMYKNISGLVNLSKNLSTENSFNSFEGLNIFQKMEVLNNLVNFLSGTFVACDLLLIGLSKNTGKLTIPINIPLNFELVSKSVTGFYEKILFSLKK